MYGNYVLRIDSWYFDKPDLKKESQDLLNSLISAWGVLDSNQRPLACQASVLNQLN